MEAHPGGAPANFLAALSKFGAKTALMAKVGDDAFGALLRATLEQAGISTAGLVTDPEVFTTLAFVTLDPHGDRSFSFARKPGADTCLRQEELDLTLIDQAKVFHFGTLSLTHSPAREATLAAVEYARAAGKLITFDPNLRPPLWQDLEEAKRWMLWGLEQADVVKISDNEVDFLFGTTPEKGADHILKTFGCQLVFVTCGGDGAVYANPNACGRVPALSGISATDTTGAGDIFGGSAVWKILQTEARPDALTGAQLHEITAFACTAASLSTTCAGGISSVPELDEVIKFLSL
jgi:fructokinase